MPGVYNAISDEPDTDDDLVIDLQSRTVPNELNDLKQAKQLNNTPSELSLTSLHQPEASADIHKKLHSPLHWHKSPSPAFTTKQRQARRRSSLCISESATETTEDALTQESIKEDQLLKENTRYNRSGSPTRSRMSKPSLGRPAFQICSECRDHILNTSPLGPPLHTSPHQPAFMHRRRSSYDTTHLVGSYEESLLSGRMSAPSSQPVPFHIKLGALGSGKNCPAKLKFPKHLSTQFDAVFYDHDLHETGTHGRGSPYVGVIDLEHHYKTTRDQSKAHKFPGYRIPRKGQIQLIISNLQKTAVKLFLVPYDMSNLKPAQKTFIRQKVYVQEGSGKTLFQAVHFQVASPAKGRYYLYGDLRLVFQNRASTADASSLVSSPVLPAMLNAAPTNGSGTYLGISRNRDRLKVETVSGGYSNFKVGSMYSPTLKTIDRFEGSVPVLQHPTPTSTPNSSDESTCARCQSPISATPAVTDAAAPSSDSPTLTSDTVNSASGVIFQSREELKAQMLTDLKAYSLDSDRV